MPSGILYGISVGTGDPELITLKGLRRLENSPVVAFPAAIDGKSGIAETIISKYIKPAQIKLPLSFPYVREPTRLIQAWEKASMEVWKYLERGMDVAFVCEGDVSFYSSFTYLVQTIQQLHPQVKVEAIPGVSSPMAAAAALGIPLTVRHQRLVILPALYGVSELETVLDWAEVVVLLKVSPVYGRVWQILQARNLLHRAWVVERATFPEQKTYANLGDRPNLKLSYFSILVIHNFDE